MAEFISENLGTIIASVLLVVAIVGAVFYVINHHGGSCDNCSSCPLSDNCKKKNGEKSEKENKKN